nr:hypothetical protein L204_00779 [Cryptococcus depauperatus CBS 7855]
MSEQPFNVATWDRIRASHGMYASSPDIQMKEQELFMQMYERANLPGQQTQQHNQGSFLGQVENGHFPAVGPQGDAYGYWPASMQGIAEPPRSINPKLLNQPSPFINPVVSRDLTSVNPSDVAHNQSALSGQFYSSHRLSVSVEQQLQQYQQPERSSSVSSLAGLKHSGFSIPPNLADGQFQAPENIQVIDLSKSPDDETPPINLSQLHQSVRSDGPSFSSAPVQGRLDTYLLPASEPSQFLPNVTKSQPFATTTPLPVVNPVQGKVKSDKHSSSDVKMNLPQPISDTTMTMTDIRRLITPESLKKSPGELFKNLRMRGPNVDEPPLFIPKPDELREILCQLRDHATKEYLAKMADNEKYLFLWLKWLRQARKDPETWEKVIEPMLQVLARTEMSLERAKNSDIAKVARLLANTAKEKNLASAGDILAAFQRYSKFILAVGRRLDAEEAKNDQASGSGAAGKRKVDQVDKDSIKVKEEPLSKRPSTSTSNNKILTKPPLPAKAPIKPTSASMVSDMSFFKPTAPSSTVAKPKPKQAVKPPITEPTKPAFSVSNLLAKLQNNPGASSSQNVEVKPETSSPRYTKSGRLIRSVTWKTDADLVQVREFVPDPSEKEMKSFGPGMNAHELDKQEGAMLARNSNRGEIDWYDPDPYMDELAYPLVETEAAKEQKQRERGTLAVHYLPRQQIPDPSESDVRLVAAQDNNTRLMIATLVSVEPELIAPPDPKPDISILLANLSNIPLQSAGTAQPMANQPPIGQYPYQFNHPPHPYASAQIPGFNPLPPGPYDTFYGQQPVGGPTINHGQQQQQERRWDEQDDPQKKGSSKKKGGVWKPGKKGSKTCQWWAQGE